MCDPLGIKLPIKAALILYLLPPEFHTVSACSATENL